MRPESLDPDLFIVGQPTAVIDEFQMRSDKTGEVVTTIDRAWLDATAEEMLKRESDTGDLAPFIIGHTVDNSGTNEEFGPRVVGFAKDWHVAPLFETGRSALFVIPWIYRKDADEVRHDYPRRSAEVWVSSHQIDPISLLGPTTPARDLGLLKLSRNSSGSLAVESPGKLNMPEATKPDAAAKNELPVNQEILAKLDQTLAGINSLVEILKGSAPPAGGEPAAPAGGPPGEGELTDEELAQLLGESGAPGQPGAPGDKQPPAPEDEEDKRKTEQPVKNAGYPGGNCEPARMAREVAELKIQLARLSIEKRISDARVTGKDVQIDPADLADFSAMPPDMRERQLANRIKLSRDLPRESFGLNYALSNAADPESRGTATTVELRDKAIRLAREEKTTYEAAIEKITGKPFNPTRG